MTGQTLAGFFVAAAVAFGQGLSTDSEVITRNVALYFTASDAHVSEISETGSLEMQGLGVLDDPVFNEAKQEGWNDLASPSEKRRPSNAWLAVSAGQLTGKPATQSAFVAEKAVLKLSISHGTFTVSWWPTGGTLQSTSLLRGTSTLWTNVTTANPTVVQIGAAASFYRVVQ